MVKSGRSPLPATPPTPVVAVFNPNRYTAAQRSSSLPFAAAWPRPMRSLAWHRSISAGRSAPSTHLNQSTATEIRLFNRRAFKLPAESYDDLGPPLVCPLRGARTNLVLDTWAPAMLNKSLGPVCRSAQAQGNRRPPPCRNERRPLSTAGPAAAPACWLASGCRSSLQPPSEKVERSGRKWFASTRSPCDELIALAPLAGSETAPPAADAPARTC